MSKFKKFKRGWLGGKTEWKISSPMGYRKPPKGGASRYHRGNDVSTPTGTKIYAPCDGTVIKEKQGRGIGGGLYVTLKANEGDYNFYFMHLSKVIKTGGVKEGDLIAETGGDPNKDPDNAGCSTGAHLHFEVREKNSLKPVDGKYFITDNWVNKRTGAIMSSELKDMPLITMNQSDYTERQTSLVNQEYNITDSDLIPTQEQDVSGSTDWDETEDSSNDEEVIIQDRELSEGLTSGIWQIIKLVLDEDVSNLRIRDAATSLQQGSLINFFQKVCQQPFVEFFGDTYGNQYYFIARRPPFDQEGMKKTMIAQGLFDDNFNENQKTIYDIYEDDILSSGISFNNQNIYSWYQFIPIYELGSPSDLQYIIPAVLFPEYAAIWGSKSMSIRSQYRDFRNSNISDSVKNEEKSEQGDSEVRNSIHDLKYLVESNAYNPFVRQGTITLLGNRRIKRGVFIRVFWNSLSCPEIFYIENVNQNYSISSGGVQRTTTLTLSHGMLSDYMFNNEQNDYSSQDNEEDRTKMSYFNLIDFGDYKKYKDKIDMDKWRGIIDSWKVNIKTFTFFLRKTQFIYSSVYDKSTESPILGKGKN